MATSDGSCSSRAPAAKIRRASGGKDVSALKNLVETGWSASDLDDMASADGKSALHMAAWHGHLDNIEYLLGLGCDVNRIATGTYSYGKTPIFFAITRCRDDACALLLERGANVRIVNNKGQTAASLASTHLRPETVAAIRRAEEKQRDVAWIDYSKTHSDGNAYGDLDPRFLTRPPAPGDVVTELVVNPTTKESRRGNFARNNPAVAREAQKWRGGSKKQRRKVRAKPNFRPTREERERLDDAWSQVDAALDGRDGEKLGTALLGVVQFWEGKKRSWIPDAAGRLRCGLAQGETGVGWRVAPEDVLAAVAESSAGPRALALLQKLLGSATEKSVRDDSNNEAEKAPSANPPLASSRGEPPSLPLWQPSFDVVRAYDLSWSDLRNPTRSEEYLSLPRPPVWVDSLDDLVGLRSHLMALARHRDGENLFAFDTEWCDIKNGKIGLATIQLSLVEEGRLMAWVIDLKPEECIECGPDDVSERNRYLSAASELLHWLFFCSNAVLLGFSVAGHDITKISSFLGCSIPASRCLDLQSLAAEIMHTSGHCKTRGVLPGLQTCCSHFQASKNAEDARLTLSKSEQCSDWKKRPLSRSQLEYAGLDAGVLLVLLAEITKNQLNWRKENVIGPS